MTPRSWSLSAWFMVSAVRRMRRDRSEWATAMLAEAASCSSRTELLAWACGCWLTSLRVTIPLTTLVYPTALLVGLASMTAFEWREDEGAATVLVLGLIAMALGALEPRRAVLSGILLGLVVACVICFEAATGVRPTYETGAQSLASGLYWTILLVPAMPLAALGALIGYLLRTTWRHPDAA